MKRRGSAPKLRRAARRAFTVALIGPDGAGKSTIAHEVEQMLPMPVTYLYMGVNMSAGNRVLPTTRLVDRMRTRSGGPSKDPATWHDDTPGARGAVATGRSLLRLGYWLAEEWYRQAIAWTHLARGRVVLFDRHFFADYYATDIKAGSRTLARRIHGLVLQRLYPKPDLLILLDAPAEVLHRRKGEGTIESLERKRQEYLEVGRSMEHFVVIDTERPPTEVASSVVAAIVEFGTATNRPVA